jgi:hypothetical protein
MTNELAKRVKEHDAGRGNCVSVYLPKTSNFAAAQATESELLYAPKGGVSRQFAAITWNRTFAMGR